MNLYWYEVLLWRFMIKPLIFPYFMHKKIIILSIMFGPILKYWKSDFYIYSCMYLSRSESYGFALRTVFLLCFYSVIPAGKKNILKILGQMHLTTNHKKSEIINIVVGLNAFLDYISLNIKYWIKR